LAVLSGVPLGLFGDAIDGVWIALVGGFLFSVATASYPKSGESEVRPVAG
jgi:hypothetical protein